MRALAFTVLSATVAWDAVLAGASRLWRTLSGLGKPNRAETGCLNDIDQNSS
jgi:hypothetical protein